MESNVVADTNRASEIKAKMQFTGKVLKVGLAGAIIDLGLEKPGVIHISQLVSEDGQAIKRVEDVLKEGQSVDVWIKKVVRKDDEERVELTMIKPLDLEWREIKKDMVVKGKVVRLEKFGAFVEIGAERPGLVHISEMSHGYVKQPGDVMKEGDEIEAMVIEVNRRKKQIKLSLKALEPEPEPTVVEPTPRMAFERPKTEKRPRKTTSKSRRVSDVDNSELIDGISEPSAEAEPTAMEIALREAMERAKAKKKSDEPRKAGKAVSQVQEDILARTLDNKVQTN